MYECREAHGCAGAAGDTPPPAKKKTGPEGPVSDTALCLFNRYG